MGSITSLIAAIRGKQRPFPPYNVLLDELGKGKWSFLNLVDTDKLFPVSEEQIWGKPENCKIS